MRGQGGFALVEFVVSAIVVVVVAGGALTALPGQQPHRTPRSATVPSLRDRPGGPGADALAADLRPLEPGQEPDGVTSRPVHGEVSAGEFVTDSTGTASCAGTASADYVRITSRSPGRRSARARRSLAEHRRAAERLDRARSRRPGGLRPGGQGQGIAGVGLLGTGPGRSAARPARTAARSSATCRRATTR